MRFRALFFTVLFSALAISDPAFAQTISGSIHDTDGNPLKGAVRLLGSSGNHVGHYWVDEFGNFQTDLLAGGTYFAVTLETHEMLDEAWDDILCENLLCDIPSSTPIVVAGGNQTGIDFVLEPIVTGGRISGQVTDGSDVPLTNVIVQIRNSDGEYLLELWTDAGGNYQTALQADHSYFANTLHEPFGLGRELYDDFLCLPADICGDPAYIKANATPVVVSGADKPGIDFKLAVPAGGMISGRVTDFDTGVPLPDVHMNLLDAVGNYVANTNTDLTGDYYFSGLAYGSYKVIAIDVPDGYTVELYDGEHCPNAECNLTTVGTILTISGSLTTITDIDIVLDYTGTRLLGTITRSDSDVPVSSQYAHMGVDLFSESGDHLGFSNTNRAGQYQLTVPGAGSYYLVTTMDIEFHGLINEAWDGIKCSHNCNPLDIGANLIAVADGATVEADFVLDPGFNISGTIQREGSATGEGFVNIWDDSGQYVTSAGNDGGGNWISDPLPPGTYYATARGEDWGLVSQLYNSLSCPQEYCDKASGNPIELSDSDVTGIDFILVPFSEDWTISGSMFDNSNNPVGGVAQLFDPYGRFLRDVGVDELGNFQIGPLANGTYFATTVHTPELLDEAWDDFPCNNGLCDVTASTPIVIDGADYSGIDFVLDPILAGGRISGQATDSSDDPLAGVMIVVRNSNGEYLLELWTDPGGNYQTDLLADDRYYLQTAVEPFGLGRELYDNFLCMPADACDDPAYIKSRATPVDITGSDRTGIDFKLETPEGGLISGKVTDADTNAPLWDVHMNVLDVSGGFVANTNTDPSGDYYFSGLPDGDYKIIAIGVPLGYSGELFGGDHCHEWNCDLTVSGDIITITGGAVADGKDIILDYEGTRLFGTVTRSDTHAPVSNQFAHMNVDLFNGAGQPIGGSGTNPAGQFQFELSGAGNYYLAATNDWNIHGLINEVWDDIQCDYNCNPLDLGGTAIPVAEGETVVANFVLDPSFTISGTIQIDGSPAIGPTVNIWDSDGHFVTGAGTDENGNWTTDRLAAGTYFATVRGEFAGMVSQLYNGISCPQEFCDVTTGTPIEVSDANITGIDFHMAPISADWVISGSVLDSGGGPVGGDIRLFDPFGNFIGDFGIDGAGNFQSGHLANGTYFAVTVKTHELLDEAWDSIPCENLLCDIAASTAIVINGADRNGIDFVLDPILVGGRISGLVQDNSGAPLPNVNLIIRNSNGEYLTETQSNLSGNYQTALLADYSYFVHTSREPLGLRRELYDDIPCLPADICWDPAYVTNSGTAVVIDGADETGVDFKLEEPMGGLITGRVTDFDIGIPLPDVHLDLLDEFGNYRANTDTDSFGNYYFSDLEDGNYKVLAIWVPRRYTEELFGGDHCPNAECDRSVLGTIITISGGAVADHKDIALDYEGTRLTGTITRSDTGAPVANQYGLMGVDVYLESGQYVRFFGTNSAGQFKIQPNVARKYYLVTRNEMAYHGLLDEVWDDIRCYDDCSPTIPGAILIDVPENTTVVADFILDPEVVFKSGFE